MNYPEDFINKIICGDNLEKMKDIHDESVDLVLTDPPYNIEREFGRRSKQRRSMIGDNLSMEDYLVWVKKVYAELFRVLKSDRALLTECAPSYLAKIITVVEEVGFRYEYQYILYTSNNMRRGKTGYAHYNSMLWFSKGKSKRRYDYPDVIKSSLKSTIREFRHPSPKNVVHYSKLIDIFTDEGDIVIDPFLGSGTTAIACKQLNRRFIGIEILQDYCSIATRRLEKIIKVEKDI